MRRRNCRPTGTTEPRYCRTSSGWSRTASLIGQKITPALPSVSRNVVATDTLSNTASTATCVPCTLSGSTPARIARSFSGMPSFSYIFSSSGSTSSRLFEARFALGRRVVVQVLVVDRRMLDARPMRLGHLPPGGEGLQPPLQQPFGLLLARGDQPDDVLVQPLGREVHLDVRLEAPLVAGLGDGLDGVECFGSQRHSAILFGGGDRHRRAAGDAEDGRDRRHPACRPG